MDRFRAISTFVRIVESGSFARAAERLDASVSSVSRQLAELEAHLNVRLLNRTTRRLSLTESGQAFFERAVQLLAELDEAEEAATAGSAAPRGTLRVTAPVFFGSHYLAPGIARFLERHPRMRFELALTDHALDLVEEGIDLAVRIGAVGSQNLVGRRVGFTRLLCCASPDYLDRHGAPQVPADLLEHACLTYRYAAQRNAWVFTNGEGTEHRIRVNGNVHANNGEVLTELAAAGGGIALVPDFMAARHLRAGALRTLLPGFRAPRSSIYLAYPSRRYLSAKVRAFCEFLLAMFADARWTTEPPPPPDGGTDARDALTTR